MVTKLDPAKWMVVGIIPSKDPTLPLGVTESHIMAVNLPEDAAWMLSRSISDFVGHAIEATGGRAYSGEPAGEYPGIMAINNAQYLAEVEQLARELEAKKPHLQVL